MHRRTRAVVAAVALLGALAGCARSEEPVAADRVTEASAGLAASSNEAPATTTTTVDPGVPPADPGAAGPFVVGRTTFTATDPERGGRELPVDVWYPAPAGTTGTPSVYELGGEATVSSVALQEPEAALDLFPLVVFSHGAAGLRFQSFSLAEALASHGFVVAAPDHPGSTMADEVAGSEASFDDVAVDRPLDVGLVIDRLLERSATAGDRLVGRIDPASVGVVGHSLGGFTALAVAGGTDSVEADERVSAAVPIAPVSSLLSDTNLAAVRVPTLLVGGTADTVTPIDDELTRPFSLIRAGALRRVDVVGAAHWSFTDVCQLEATVRFVDAEPAVERAWAANAVGACGPGALPADRAETLTNRYVVAFLQVHLGGDSRYNTFLDRVDGVEVHVR